MRFLPFVLRHLRHNWVRTGSTVLAMVICFFIKSLRTARLATKNPSRSPCNVPEGPL